MKGQAVTPLSKLSKRSLITRYRQLARAYSELTESFHDSIMAVTLERDMKAGTTLQVRVPKKCLSR